MTTETAMDERLPPMQTRLLDEHELNECKIARMKPREEDKPGWGHPVMMTFWGALLIGLGLGYAAGRSVGVW